MTDNIRSVIFDTRITFAYIMYQATSELYWASVNPTISANSINYLDRQH